MSCTRPTYCHNPDVVLFVEQRGCIYCKKMHEEVFVVPELSDYIEENFFVVQMNLHGDDTAVDFDGEEAAQSDLMRKWGILFTPTLIFLPAAARARR